MLVPAVRILALTAPWRADARWTLGIIMTLPFGGSSTNDAGTGTPRSAYDWNGVVGTGQSLSVGEPGGAGNTPAGVARLTDNRSAT